MTNVIFDSFIIELREDEHFLEMYDYLRWNYIIDFLWLLDLKYDFSRKELIKIIEYSSLLAISDDISNIEVSQKINSYLYYLYENNDDILYGLQMIYSRIWNYPILEQKDVFKKNIYNNDDNSFIVDTDLKNELNSWREKSKIIINGKDKFINKFQISLLDKINNNKLISISAPTSFWKSFIVRTYLSQIYSTNQNFTTLIIVPSKALIDDFIWEFISMKKEFWFTYNVVSHFIPEDENIKNKVFILTQERLLAVIRKNPKILEKIDLLYCDEAHKISFSWRWFLLKKVIEIFNIHSKNSKKIFTSPIIKNPNYFKDKFYQSMSEWYSHELVEYKPVEKNIFLFDIKSIWEYDIHYLDNVRWFEYKKNLIQNDIELSKSKYNDWTDKDFYKFDIIFNNTIKWWTVIYVNSKIKLLKYWKYLLKLINKNNDKITNLEYKAIEDYISENFHNWLYVLEFLKKWIWIHAWFLPVWLRNKVVELFKEKKIKYLLCTSTLLEWVNLPIKNIVLINNKSWRQVLWKLDFLNLIWRAWRFRYELSWNVILFSDNNKNFFDEYFNINKEELILKDVETNILTKRTKKLEFFKFFDSTWPDEIYRKMDVDVYEHMFYWAYTEDDFLDKLWLKDIEKDTIKQLIEFDKQDEFYSKWIFEQNLWIAPHSQLKLYKKLNSFADKELLKLFNIIEDKYSLTKDITDVLLILQNIFSVVPSKYFSYNKVTKEKFFNPLSEYMRILNWIKWKSLKEIIDINLYYYIKWQLHSFKKFKEYSKLSEYYKYLEKNDIKIDFEENIIKTLDYYNNIIWFKWTKYIRVFYNILLEILIERGIEIDKDDYISKVESFLFTLETWINSSLWKFLYSKWLPRSLCVKTNKLILFFISDVDEWNDDIIKEYFSKKRIKWILKIWLSNISYDELYFNLDMD